MANVLFMLVLLFATGMSATLWRPLSGGNTRRESLGVLFMLLAFTLTDWALLAALPALGLSYGPVAPALAGITAVRTLVLFVLLLVLGFWKLILPKPVPKLARFPGVKYTLLVFLVLNLGVSIAEIDGLYIEPFSLQLSEVHVTGPSLIPGRSLSILHLSDLHVERTGPRERKLLEMVREIQPDLIVLTGDYPNIDYKHDPQSLADTRALLAELSAPHGVYAVTGTPAVDIPAALESIFDGLEIELLQDEIHRLVFESGELHILGVGNLGYERDRAALDDLMAVVPEGNASLLLYHTPDLVEAADRLGVDFYLAGHTHGGQIRLPFYGALITSSRFGKMYESGRYALEHTELYVSRGIGMEGLSMPRARFFCPPEVVLIHYGPEGST